MLLRIALYSTPLFIFMSYIRITFVSNKWVYTLHIQVHLNELECREKVIFFSNSTQIVKLEY